MMKMGCGTAWKAKGSMIRHIRMGIAGIVFVLFTLTFLGIPVLALPMTQFFPALLAANAAVFIIILAATLLIGRIYCAVLCPLGILQDIVWWMANRVRRQPRKVSYTEEHTCLRYAILLAIMLTMAAGSAAVLDILEPYSMFGRIVSAIVLPVWQYAGSETMVAEPVNGMEALFAAIISFICIAGLAFRYGRLYCNTICPVGTMLGTVSRFSLYGIVFDTKKCIHCKQCEHQCRASCIDAARRHVDGSRCVDCLDCVAVCPNEALSVSGRYSRIPESEMADMPENARMSRRDMLIRVGVVVTAAAIGFAKHQLPVEAAMDDVPSDGPVMPPGAKSLANFTQRCTACQRCVSNCPGGVLVPSVIAYNGAGLWQPHLDYTKGYCVLDCTICSQVCPTGAIQPLDGETKKTMQIGKAIYNPFQCLTNTEGISCGNCARNCPVQAIDMLPDGDIILPHIRHNSCIGCGACAYHCPAQAITVKTMCIQKPLGTGRRQRQKKDIS